MARPLVRRLRTEHAALQTQRQQLRVNELQQNQPAPWPNINANITLIQDNMLNLFVGLLLQNWQAAPLALQHQPQQLDNANAFVRSFATPGGDAFSHMHHFMQQQLRQPNPIGQVQPDAMLDHFYHALQGDAQAIIALDGLRRVAQPTLGATPVPADEITGASSNNLASKPRQP